MDSDDEEAIYIVRGTPLPEIEDTLPNRKAVQDLTVRDERGRQRFHGAFTGGFSAGYFNTVGTKEGWEPSNFVSSRASKAASTNFHQKPEDFMDDEDFGEFGIAPKRIRTTANFSDKNDESRKGQKAVHDLDAVIPGEPPLKELVKPVLESIGVAMLKKMGWRHGQGIGPQVKKHEPEKVVGCSLGPLATDRADPFTEYFMYAPEDTPAVFYVPKDDLHGIGYSGLSTESVLGLPSSSSYSNSTKSWLAKDKKKLSISGQAFGIGALEDDDDGDVYSREDMSQYDFSEFLGEKSRKNSNKTQETRKESDLSAIQGFCLAVQQQTKKKQYPLPDLPPGFVPLHQSTSSVHVKTSNGSEITKHKLNPALRSVLLGEKAFTKPVTQIETSDERGKLRRSRFDQKPEFATAVTSLNAPQLITTCTLSVPPLMKMKFKPFVKDSLKQKRYEEWLSNNCDKDYLRSIQPSTLTEWEKQLELDEFTKTASFYQPLSKELDSRFESRSHLDVEVVSGVIKKPKKFEDTPSENRSLVPLREIFEWHPTSLLCKRFNIPNPYPDSQIEGVPGTETKKPSLFDSLSFGQETDDRKFMLDQPQASNSDSISNLDEAKPKYDDKNVPKTVFSIDERDNAEQDTEASNNLPKEKPPMDLFKEIFASSSSEDSSDEDLEGKDDDPPKADLPVSEPQSISLRDVNDTRDANTSNVTKVPKTAFGVFANLDLDALNKRTSSTTKTVDPSGSSSKPADKEESLSEVQQASTTPDEDSMKAAVPSDSYGPEPPPQGVQPTRFEWIHKQYKHKHKHHKHKEKKIKKKKKHKQAKHKKEDDSSSESEEEELLSERIVEKLKKLQDRKKNRR